MNRTLLQVLQRVSQLFFTCVIILTLSRALQGGRYLLCFIEEDVETQRIEITEQFGSSTVTGIKLDPQLGGLSTSIENTPRSKTVTPAPSPSAPCLPGLRFTPEHLSPVNIFLTSLFCPSCLPPLERKLCDHMDFYLFYSSIYLYASNIDCLAPGVCSSNLVEQMNYYYASFA